MNYNTEIQKVKNLFNWPLECPIVKENKQHWFQDAGKFGFEHLFNKRNPKIILELGSWTGAGSTTYILNKRLQSHLICVDHWSEDRNVHAEQFKDGNLSQINADAHIYPVLWNTFLHNTWEYRERLTPIRKKTSDALPYLYELNIPIDMIYIDAHHNYDAAFHDISKCLEYWPNAEICGDDFNWHCSGDGGVSQAVTECSKSYNLRYNVIDGLFWYFEK